MVLLLPSSTKTTKPGLPSTRSALRAPFWAASNSSKWFCRLFTRSWQNLRERSEQHLTRRKPKPKSKNPASQAASWPGARGLQWMLSDSAEKGRDCQPQRQSAVGHGWGFLYRQFKLASGGEPGIRATQEECRECPLFSSYLITITACFQSLSLLWFGFWASLWFQLFQTCYSFTLRATNKLWEWVLIFLKCLS